MQKIASPRELQAEIQAVMAFVHASEKPDRQVIASKLRELADRIGADDRGKKSQRDKWRKEAQASAKSLGDAAENLSLKLQHGTQYPRSKNGWDDLDELGVKHGKESIDSGLKWVKQRYDELVKHANNVKSYL